jgi:transposase InsO family protein
MIVIDVMRVPPRACCFFGLVTFQQRRHVSEKAKIFDYIEAFDNTTRMHSSLDYASPAQFEAAA